MTLDELVTQKRTELNAQISLRNQYATELDELRSAPKADPTEVENLRAAKARVDAVLIPLQASFEALERDAASDAKATADAATSTPTGVQRQFGGGSTEPEIRAGDWVDTNSGKRVSLRSGETFRSHVSASGESNPNDERAIGQYGGVGGMLRAMTTTSGTAIVPTLWSADLIDRARNFAQVLQAGATVIPMTTKQLNIGRLTGDPSAAFRAEGSLIPQPDPTFDNVVLNARTQSALVVGSLEWFQDADNADEIVSDAIAKAIALQLDLVALYGGTITGAGSINLPAPVNPTGILAGLTAQLPANILGNATNGSVQAGTSYFNELLDTIYQVRAGNEEPNALIWNSKVGRQYAGGYDTTGQPLRLPQDVEGITRLVSNQIPSRTQGTMVNRASDIFAGDWSKLLIGQRLGITLQTLTERYADNGQIGIVAHWRGDVAIARPSAFSMFRAIQGSV